MASSGQHRLGQLFTFFYSTRVKIHHGDTIVVNLSLLFMIVAVSTAPWLAAIGLIACLALGYQFSMERCSPDFQSSFSDVFDSARQNVKDAMNSVSSDPEE
jgi:hypothetical protein